VQAKRTIKKSLSKLSPHSKISAIAETCSETLTPNSKFAVAEKVESVTENVYKTIAKKRDPISNSARRVLLSNYVHQSGSMRSARRYNRRYNWTTLQHAGSADISEIIVHYKTTKTKKNIHHLKINKKLLTFITEIVYQDNCLIKIRLIKSKILMVIMFVSLFELWR